MDRFFRLLEILGLLLSLGSNYALSSPPVPASRICPITPRLPGHNHFYLLRIELVRLESKGIA